jgi:hypothetical protein
VEKIDCCINYTKEMGVHMFACMHVGIEMCILGAAKKFLEFFDIDSLVHCSIVPPRQSITGNFFLCARFAWAAQSSSEEVVGQMIRKMGSAL